ncbi:dUTP diphosphatase [Candidatus Gracilibacteria bacterium]|nr:dUTP diphosphatase [Candidatus Gracilibacteria bacterium]
MFNLTLRVKRLSSAAVLPVKSSANAAGYDLSSSEDCVVPALGKCIVPTGLAIEVPEGTYGRIAPRSGLAWKKHINVAAGVIDADYRGPVGIVLFNHSVQAFVITRGDRVAQLILERIADAEVVEVDSLEDTERGDGGYGSTGAR